uniref:Uncharacterized protein n=1 Tax=Trichogramma kaykai TaxID=54128 RepID=A0ABD2WI19_9HYME
MRNIAHVNCCACGFVCFCFSYVYGTYGLGKKTMVGTRPRAQNFNWEDTINLTQSKKNRIRHETYDLLLNSFQVSFKVYARQYVVSFGRTRLLRRTWNHQIQDYFTLNSKSNWKSIYLALDLVKPPADKSQTIYRYLLYIVKSSRGVKWSEGYSTRRSGNSFLEFMNPKQQRVRIRVRESRSRRRQEARCKQGFIDWP